MTPYDELFAIANEMDAVQASAVLEAAEGQLSDLNKTAREAGRAFSGSWLGYHAYVYYRDLEPPPPGAHFSQEWGLTELSSTSLGSRGEWVEYDPVQLKNHLIEISGNPDLRNVEIAAQKAGEMFEEAKARIESILVSEEKTDAFLTRLQGELSNLHLLTERTILKKWSPSGRAIMSRETTAVGQGIWTPPHQALLAKVAVVRHSFNLCQKAAQISRKAGSHLERLARREKRDARIGTNVFIGHGRSPVWRELKDFVNDRLNLPWDEFNRVPVAGVTNQARLSEMLDAAAVALIIMTAEDETADGEVQARMNVIHEVGLFQGRLGFTKAIVLFEDGCQDFSNIQGLGQIRFPRGEIAACFENVRQLLEREGMLLD